MHLNCVIQSLMAASSKELAEPDVVVEICCESIDSVMAAAAAGADRVELCASLIEGGVTPSAGLVQASVGILPTAVLIRPRPGDFVYSAVELDIMVRDAEHAKSAGAVAVVTGALQPDGELDCHAMQRLVAAAAPLEVVLHRAIDVCACPLRAVVASRLLGVSRILTSGGSCCAADAVDKLCAMKEAAESPIERLPVALREHAKLVAAATGTVVAGAGRVAIMAGGGLSAANVAQLIAAAGLREVHGSGESVSGRDVPCLRLVRAS